MICIRIKSTIINKSSKFFHSVNKKRGPLKTRKFKMVVPILHTLAHPAHSLRPLLTLCYLTASSVFWRRRILKRGVAQPTRKRWASSGTLVSLRVLHDRLICEKHLSILWQSPKTTVLYQLSISSKFTSSCQDKLLIHTSSCQIHTSSCHDDSHEFMPGLRNYWTNR